ncbi:uncharacterized protein LOC123884202 [Trifolium pratense]|uniref:uncharacterized protein LOC123884202 n=1 Tax=Trifolium pratense TaxID=57577 RepID=UPI001E6919DA|nr:uncharacterized protein LOC123884202 [Trifolium pratense]
MPLSISVRDVPPADYLFKIQSYSLLVESKVEMFDSNYFQAGGYTWKLILYPNGNSNSNGKDHVSLYLAIVDPENFTGGWEINVNFKLFVFDAINNNYLTMQDGDGAVRKFHELKTEWGFDQLISLKDLKVKSNGYLVKDSCVFGAEVFVIGHSGNWETLSMVKDPPFATLTWKLEKFSTLDKTSYYSTKSITVGERDWKVKVFPKGVESIRGKYLSLYLNLTDCEKFPSNRTVYARYKFKIIDQLNGKDLEKTAGKNFSFGVSNDLLGFNKFISLSELNEAAKGYIKDDVMIIELQIINISMIKINPSVDNGCGVVDN